MNQSYNQMFAENDLLEENKFQQVYLGHKQGNEASRVIIHKFKKSERFDEVFKELLESLQNKLYIEENDQEIILVSKYLEGDNISLHMNFSSVDINERLDYLYEYLHQAVAYIGFDNYLFNNFISSNQIVFIDHRLYLKEQIILDRRLDDELPFTMIAKNLGQVMQRLLITNFNDLRTSKKYDDLHRFTESLIRREKDYKNFDELFNDFKAIYFTRSFSKKKPLQGELHPNNMFLDQTQEMPFIPTPVEKEEEPVPEKESTPAITMEVTEQERAILTGPIEESIDLSRLDNNISTLEDLIVKENEPDKEKEDSEEPHYGVPQHFKDDSYQEQEEKDPPRFLIPLLAAIFVTIIAVIGIIGWRSLQQDDVVPVPPVASFNAVFEDNALVCTNLSEAYNDETIVQSLWVIMKDGKEVTSKAGDNKSDFRAKNLQEGVYTIKLTVTDSAGQFSDPFVIEKEYLSPESKAIRNQSMSEAAEAKGQKSADNNSKSTDTLDEYAISATSNVTTDTSTFNEGNKSYRIDLSEGDATLSFNDLDVPASSTISFYMMVNKAEDIAVNITGYNNGLNNYDKTLNISNTDVLSWKVVSVQVNLNEPTDNIILKFPQKNLNLWVDDLSIRTFK